MDAVTAARNALEACLDAQPGEYLLIVADDARRAVATAFARGGIELGLWVRHVELPTTDAAREHVPAVAREALLAPSRVDVVLNFFRGGGLETPFRIAYLDLERHRPVRVGHCPGTTLDMLTEGALALSRTEYAAMQARAQRLLQALQGTTRVHLTTPAGTDCTLDVTGRQWWTETRYDWALRKWINLPVGEVLVGPVESGPAAWTGTFVCDFAMGGWPGEIPSPVTLTVREGAVEAVECADADARARVETTLETDAWARRVGEFAFGLNPRARVHEEFVETEKLPTVHIAVGNNLDYPGVTRNASRTHLDFLVRDPTVEVTDAAGQTRVVMRAGTYVLDGIRDA